MKTTIYSMIAIFSLNATAALYQGDFEAANAEGDGIVTALNLLSSQTSSSAIEIQETGSPDKKYVDFDIQEGFRIEAISTTSSSVI